MAASIGFFSTPACAPDSHQAELGQISVPKLILSHGRTLDRIVSWAGMARTVLLPTCYFVDMENSSNVKHHGLLTSDCVASRPETRVPGSCRLMLWRVSFFSVFGMMCMADGSVCPRSSSPSWQSACEKIRCPPSIQTLHRAEG